jgi:bacterioferritin
MDCKVKADLPYPTAEADEKSMYEVGLLMPAYGGRASETTAIMSYIYQSYVLKKNYPDVASCLEKIGITEMTHHELLGTMITSLGGTPYIGGNTGYWQGGYVNYNKNLMIILNNDIADEKHAIADYKEIIRRSKCEAVRVLVARIIEDEEVHIVTLEGIKEQYK